MGLSPSEILRRTRIRSAFLVAERETQVSEIIDMRGFRSMVFSILTGVIDDANATFVVLIEEGDDSGLSDAAAVDDVDLNGTATRINFDFDDDNQARKIGYRGIKRYVRMTITPSGNSANPTGAFFAAVAILSHASESPTDAQAT